MNESNDTIYTVPPSCTRKMKYLDYMAFKKGYDLISVNENFSRPIKSRSYELDFRVKIIPKFSFLNYEINMRTVDPSF